MKTLWTFTALVLATLYHGSHQKPSQPSQSSSEMSRILVVAGDKDIDTRLKKTELFPKPDSKCAMLDDFPLEVAGAVGFWTARGPTVCGGYDGPTPPLGIEPEHRCFIYKEHQWKPWTNMRSRRYGSSAIQINPNQALIIGGEYVNYSRMKSIELISSSGSARRNDFPMTISRHCSFKINATHALVTGGIQGFRNYYSANTWFVDLTTTTFTQGPTMKAGRNDHGCSIFHNGTKSFGIISGGTMSGAIAINSTEMIDFDQESPEWTEGPKLPRELKYLTLAETSQGTYAMGGKDNDYNYRNEVIQLNCPDDQIHRCQWKEVGNLQFGRSRHVSIPLPDSYDVCKPTPPPPPTTTTITASGMSGTTKTQHDLKIISIVLSIAFLFSFSTKNIF